MPSTIIVGSSSFAVEPGAQERFWKRVARGDWERETFAVFDRFIGPDTLFLDVGAWVGATALYGAQRAARCVAFEPDPVAFAALSRNLAANAGAAWLDRLQIQDCAINKDGASFTLGGSAEGADSMSSGLFPDSASQWTVQAMRLPDVLEAHRAPGQRTFIKIDIEGGEYDLLPAIREVMADPSVTAFISFHPQLLRRALSQAQPEADAAAAFIDRHMAVIESLPWARRIATQEGSALERGSLEDRLRRKARFPRELLVCDA